MLSRDAVWNDLSHPLDLLVVGGGVTGAGILLEAARRGLKAALVERGDFAGGTSSRSSKLVHGGLRYLKEGKLGLTRESVREREALLREAPGLVEPMPFMMPAYEHSRPGRTVTQLGLALYDMLAGRRDHGYVDATRALREEPSLAKSGLLGAHTFFDATTDDARLVLRLLAEAERFGGRAINYVEALTVEREQRRATASLVRDVIRKREQRITARMFINATGVFAGVADMRPLRGSHLILDHERLPLRHAVAFAHPADRRPVFAYPWEGVTLAGTTDLDHTDDLRTEPSISEDEARYLLEALDAQFPSAHITRDDVISTFAGVRPVIGSGRSPSSESRDSVLTEDRGLITITGGKLTTFRPMALRALKAACRHADVRIDFRPRRIFDDTRATAFPRLNGRYGADAREVTEFAKPGELECIANTRTTWAELRYALRCECVVHLDDALLRRTRVGLQLREGAQAIFLRVRAMCAEELGWDDAAWEHEAAAYGERIRTHYGMPA